MNPQNNKGGDRSGQALIEAIFVLFISLGLTLFMIQYALIGISKRIVQWGCFRGARTLLPYKGEMTALHLDQREAENEARTILRLIPFKRATPLIRASSTPEEVSIEITQMVSLTGKNYELHEKFSLAR